METVTSRQSTGFEYPPIPISWLKRDILLFANSIGCTSDEPQFLFEEHPDFTMFPTYPIVLPFKKQSQEVVDFFDTQMDIKIPGVPEFDLSRVVDGQRYIEFFRPLPISSEKRSFEIRSKVLGVFDKGNSGSILETQLNIVDCETGLTYVRIVSSIFYIGQGNWGGPKGPKTTVYSPPTDRSPDAVVVNQTTAETSLLYRLNGDYNPLHVTPEPGKLMGFGGTIIHGLYSWNTAAHAVLKSIGGSMPQNLRSFQARFASPVRPGDKLITEIWRTGEYQGEFEDVRFHTKIDGGRLCLNNGRALVRPVNMNTSKL